MSMKQRLYRDSSGYMNGTSGSYVEFTLPVMTSNIESQLYGANIVKYEQIDEGESYGYSFLGSWEYWDGSKWVALFTSKTLYASGSESDNKLEVDCYSSYTGFTISTFREKMRELNGKRIRWYSNSSPVYNDTNTGSTYYLELWTDYKQPTISDATFIRNYSNKAVNINVALANTVSYTVSLNGKQYTNTKSIPEEAFVVGNNTITINVINGDLSTSKAVSYNFVDYNPVAKTVGFTNSVLDNDTAIEVTANNAQRYDLYVNGVHKYTSSTQVFIPPKSCFVLGENTVFVRCYNTTSNRYADTSTYKKTFSTLQPTVSNLTFKNTGDKGNNLTHNPTVLTWQGTNYSYFNIYINDVLKISKINDLTYTMAAYSIPYGQSTIKIEVVKEALSGIANTEIKKYINLTITLDSITPAVSNINLSTTNIDRDIMISWDSKFQEWYKLLTYPNGIKLSSGTTDNSVVIPKGTIPDTETGIRLGVYMNAGGNDIVDEEIVNIEFTYDTPIIYNIEPSGLNRNVEENIEVTFALNEYIDLWVLTTGDNNIINASGTDSRSVVFGSRTFVKGINKLKLTAYYRAKHHPNATLRISTKTVEFTGYGKPISPVIDKHTTYNTSNPDIYFEYNEEYINVAYQLSLNGHIVDSGSKLASNTYVSLSDLSDNSTYDFSMRADNKYGLWSEWSSKKFTTLFNDIILPDFWLVSGKKCVQITISGIQDPNFKSLSIYRKSDTEEWVEIAHNCNAEDSVTDYTCQANMNLQYKIRVYDTNGAYKESEIKSIKIEILNYWLSNVEDFTQSFRLDFVDYNFIFNNKFVYKRFTGQSAPIPFRNRTRYNSISMQTELENHEAFEFIRFIETSNQYNIFCYRNWKGEKNFVSITLSEMKPINAHTYLVSFVMTEVKFTEKHLYSGSGYRKIVYLDGSYFLDGTLELSGYDDSIAAPNGEMIYE